MLSKGSTVSVGFNWPISKISVQAINLEATLHSGQSFCWQQLSPERWAGWIANQPCIIVREGNSYLIRGKSLTNEEISTYFQLSFDLESTLATFPIDQHLTQALRFAPGLRILRQDPWETLASFICSSVKQIVQIQEINRLLRRTFGVEVEPGHFSFPSAIALAEAGEKALRDCKLGFRARLLHQTAQQLCQNNVELVSWNQLKTPELQSNLERLPGVGPKIASCVMLFAYNRYEVFPIDVWVERVLKELYFARARNRRPDRLRKFAQDYFGPYRGYAQQYLFHWIRTK